MILQSECVGEISLTSPPTPPNDTFWYSKQEPIDDLNIQI